MTFYVFDGDVKPYSVAHSLVLHCFNGQYSTTAWVRLVPECHIVLSYSTVRGDEGGNDDNLNSEI